MNIEELREELAILNEQERNCMERIKAKRYDIETSSNEDISGSMEELSVLQEQYNNLTTRANEVYNALLTLDKEL